ncbi:MULTISPECIES: hypothetical protein [Roseovarius]|jgi:hypothetical protein|nr:hypothetical protein [Roseovarius nubinhibens]MAO27329.1 hypothetical protein [Roseovarius sp.]MBU3000182.1 hypothetical protein [Roseovarius nubinhibens]HAR53846.1 hypothetical protein [Roseovarius nubinhibens]|tara:strand:+ start:978 stop:1163 length:186 start_codon:yes stop_codon:yes gene_type:complete
MRALGLLALLTSLAACGADGEPVRPGINATIGVGSGGVHGATEVTASRGNWSFGLGLGGRS